MAGTVLITGGAGFIGSALSIKLNSCGYRVVVLDSLIEQVHGDGNDSYTYNLIKEKVRFIKGDVRNKDLLRDLLPQMDYVIHLAAETGTGQSMYELTRYTDVNINGTAAIYEVIIESKIPIKKIIIASSRSIYGEGKYECSQHGVVYPLERSEIDLQKKIFDCRCPYCDEFVKLLPTDENSALQCRSVYALTKQTQESLALMMGNTLNIPTIALRFQNVYGPGQSMKNPYTGIISIFSNAILNGHKIFIFEDGVESRDFVYIDDVVDSIKLSLESKVSGISINIGSGKPTSVLTVCQTLVKILSKGEYEIIGKYRLGDIRHNYADLRLAEKLLQYTPLHTFEEGIESFLEWAIPNKEVLSGNGYTNSLKKLDALGLFK